LSEALADNSLTESFQLACECTGTATSISVSSLRTYPTLFPTAQPSPLPSAIPTILPTPVPSPVPTPLPSSVPTSIPSSSPTRLRCLPGTFTEETDFDCNFGDGICGFANTGNSEWVEGSSVNSGSSSGVIAGPSEDHTSGSGSYVYAPAVSHSAFNQTFVLEASLGTSTGSLSFYYHLIGCANSRLTLFTQEASGVWTEKWFVAGASSSNSDNSWRLVELALEPTELGLKFVAFTSINSSQSCAAALDDVYVKKLCTLCPKGQYQASIGSFACLPCVNGSYCETEGLAAVTGLCAAGQYSGYVCEAYHSGQSIVFAIESSASFCFSQYYSTTTFVVNIFGLLFSLQIVPCGYLLPTFSSFYYTFFYSHGQTSCTLCALGKYQPSTGRSSCIDCEAGKYVASTGSIAETACTSCDAGRFKDVGSNSCTLCAAGQYQTSTGSTECISCSPGRYYDSEGAISCTECAAGMIVQCMAGCSGVCVGSTI
jgi:hypothetical protein